MKRLFFRAWCLGAWLGLGGLAALPARAVDQVPVELPQLGAAVQLPNPYRGQATVLDAGQILYAKHCAECHGDNARQAVAEGPDLRRLNSFCLRLRDSDLKGHCLKDVDSYFVQSVHEGKVRAGVVHMPAWRDVLSQEQIWAIRTFIEVQPPDRPRIGTSVDRAAGRSVSP